MENAFSLNFLRENGFLKFILKICFFFFFGINLNYFMLILKNMKNILKTFISYTSS